MTRTTRGLCDDHPSSHVMHPYQYMEDMNMTNDRYNITFNVSDDAEAKLAGDSRQVTTTIIFQGWTDEDFKVAAGETVKIRQIQARLRKGKSVGTEFIASRPGTRAAQGDVIDNLQAAIKAGTVDRDKAIAALEALLAS
jgi:hypothetical protein